jgi:hypothetical protein
VLARSLDTHARYCEAVVRVVGLSA